MTPKATTRFRQATAAFAIAWAFLALLAGVRARLEASIAPGPPFSLSSAAGRHVIHDVTPAAAAAGLAPRDRLIAVDGEPSSVWLRSGVARFVEGKPNAYRVRKPDGRELEVSLEPLSASVRSFPLETLVSYGVLLVGLVYLGIGLWVWRLKRDRRESWVLLLFCATTAALLVLVGPAYPPVPTMILLTIPWIGATAFHLFTTYPIEPPWVVRWPELRLLAYVGAGLLSLASLVAPKLGAAGAWVDPAIAFYSSGLAMLCVGLLTRERIVNRGHPSGARADVMLAGGFASYVPVVGLLLWHYFWGTSFPWSLSLLGFFVFPVAVAWGILRRELFDVRLAAKQLRVVRRRHARHHRAVRAAHHVRRRGGEPLRRGRHLPRVLGGLPVPRDRVLQPAAGARPGAGGPLLRPRPRRVPPRGARDLRGHGVDALGARDRRPHPRRGERHDGRRALDGAADGRGIGPARSGGGARRLGRGEHALLALARSPDRARPVDAAQGARARGLRRRVRSGGARGLPRRLRHARRGAARAGAVRRGPARRDRGGPEALRRTARAGRAPAPRHAREPERDRDRERDARSTRSRSSTRRSRRASRSARTSCATRRRSSCRARRCARSASSWPASRTS